MKVLVGVYSGSKGLNFSNKEVIPFGHDIETQGPSEVILEIENRNMILKIHRKVVKNSGTVQCRVYQFIDNVWEEIAGPSVSHCEKFLSTHFQMNEKTFSSSFMVRQKAIDNLVNASPDFRKQLIEQLIGVDVMSKSILDIKSDEKTIKMALSSLTQESTDELENELGKLKNEFLSKNAEKKAIEKELEKTQKLLQDQIEYINNENVKKEKYIFLNDKLNSFKLDFKLKNSIINNLLESLKDVSILDNDFDNIFNNFILQKKKLESLILNSKQELLTQESIRNNLDEILRKKTFKFSETVEDINLIKAQTIALKDTLNQEYQENIHTQKHIQFSIDNNGICPTCKQDLKDYNSEKAINDIQELKNKQQELINNIKQLDSNLDSMDSTIKEIVENNEIIENQTKARKDKIEVNKNIANLKTDIDLKESKLEVLRNEISKLEIQKTQKELFIENQNKVNNLKYELEELNKKIKIAENEILKINLDSNLKEKQKKYEIENLQYQEMKLKNNTLEFELRNILAISKEKKKLLEQISTQNQKFKEISNRLLIVSESKKILSQFKDLRLSETLPTFVNIVQDLLFKFTDGELSDFKMDSDFVPQVEKNGILINLSSCSGGELSVISLSMHIALAELLQSQEQVLMILDEVLVSMHEARAVQIMNILKEKKNSQIILIAHSPIVQAISDQIFEIA